MSDYMKKVESSSKIVNVDKRLTKSLQMCIYIFRTIYKLCETFRKVIECP